MEMGPAMTVVMVVMMLMAGGMVWGATTALGSRNRSRAEYPRRGDDR
jgi:hypothetical protein